MTREFFVLVLVNRIELIENEDEEDDLVAAWPRCDVSFSPAVSQCKVLVMIQNTKAEVSAVGQAVAHFLATGESDPVGASFPGRHALERITACESILRAALVKEVQQRAGGREHKHTPPNTNSTAWVRHKVAPMIQGLFRADECETLLAAAECSIVFLTREAIERLISEAAYPETAWTIANMYLYSLRAPRLSDKVGPAVGLSIETKTCLWSISPKRIPLQITWCMKLRTSSTTASAAL